MKKKLRFPGARSALRCKKKRYFDKYAKPFKKANSSNAAKFLRELIENVPYKVYPIQVDGGSEFIKDFEEVRRELATPFFVLPPAKPMYNGKVERSNSFFS